MIKSAKDYLEIPLPRLSFKNTDINAYLVIILIIFAFFLGVLTDRVLSLEKTLKTSPTNTTQTKQTDINNNPAQNLTPPSKVNIAIGHLPVLGAKNAKVIAIEFSDFQCPFCKQFTDNAYREIYEAYIKTGKIKFAFRHYPLSSIHPNAQKAAEASECANEQNKFWEYHDLLFKNQETWSPQATADVANTFTNYANELGMNAEQFRSCLDTDKYKDKVQEDISAGTEASVDGTPTLFINGYRLVGAQPFNAIQQVIEQELKK